ncbi:MAG TPA: A/G-specific adenine glycosylase [Xanthobacteraceae bacterium]|nr:A/G-specific adenine glycosylase [Xanthobacteraceae bacterium]
MTLAAPPRKRNRPRATPDPAGDPAHDPAAALLAWYDRHRRVLPWRALPGETAEPYAVWLSEIMLQQTTVRAVAPYFARFLARWPDVTALAQAPLDDVLREWAGLGYYARARNLHACAKVVAADHGGRFPANEAGLAGLPGIGPYTAAAIAAIAFNAPAAPVDGNIERVLSRFHAVDEPLPAAKPRIRELMAALVPHDRPGDFAQAMMDLGATICTPRSPACALCPWMEPCAARGRGTQESYPRKTPKAAGRLRRGAAFVAMRADGMVLVETRPDKGLLGGMTGFPGSEWTADFVAEEALAAAPWPDLAWRRLAGTVTHVFTHFPLELTVYVAELPRGRKAPAGRRWVAVDTLGGEALPNVMRKVAVHALGDRVRPRS